MKRYYILDKLVSEEEYNEQDHANREAVEMAEKTGDMSYLLSCKFISVFSNK